MNEIQNKLLHYRTKASFNADKNAGKISDTSIAFVDEGHIIYTHGIEYTTDVAFLLAEVDQRIKDVVAEFESNIDNAVASLREESQENHQDVIQLTRAAIEDAKSKILQVLNMIESDYVQTSEIQNINGRISAIVDWFAVQELKFTRLEQSIDAVSGQIVTSAEYTSVAQLVVNTYKQTVDASLAQLREEILSINVSEEELTNTVIGRLLDAENGVLKDYATTAWVNSQIEGVSEADITNRVEQVLNSMTPSWSTIVSQVTTNSNSNTLITQEISRLWVEANKISGLSTSVNDHSSRIAALELNSGGSGAQVSLGAIMDILDNDAERRIASEIFLTANENGSGITLAADKIDLSGNTTVLGTFISNIIQATLIDARSLTVGSGSNFIKADATNGLYHINTSTNRNSFKLNPNGSGQLGYVVTEEDGENVYTPAISWTSNGVLTINSAIIGGEGGGGTTYVENSYDDTSITNRLNVIEAWKTAMTNTENARAYLTSTGIVFDNISNSGQIVSVTSTPYSASRVIPAGVAHTKVSDGTHGYYLKNDGSGELAFGNITWDAQGNLYAKNLVMDSMTSGVENSPTIFQIINWYQQFIVYKIIKNGLVVKVGTQNGVYINSLIQEAYTEDFGKSTLNHMNYYTNLWEEYPTITGNSINGVTNSSLTTFVSSLPAAMFQDPNDSSRYLIQQGDTVLVELPLNRLTYDTTLANYTTFNITEIGGDGETAAYNAHGVTITTSEQLRNYVYSYLSGESYDGVEGHVATSEVINELIDLYMDVLEVKWKQNIYNTGSWDDVWVGNKRVVETVTDVNTQISISDYLDNQWQESYGGLRDDAVNKFTSRPLTKVIQTPIPVLESTVITWPAITNSVQVGS